MYNPCRFCGYKHPETFQGKIFCMQCGNKSPRDDWNKDNPDQVEALKRQLAECHEVLEIVASFSHVDEGIQELAKALLTKHQA
jgi:hypothetical protein